MAEAAGSEVSDPPKRSRSPSPFSELSLEGQERLERTCSLKTFSIDAILSPSTRKRAHSQEEQEPMAQVVACKSNRGDAVPTPVIARSVKTESHKKAEIIKSEKEELQSSNLEAEQGWVDWLTSFPPDRAQSRKAENDEREHERIVEQSPIACTSEVSTFNNFATSDGSKMAAIATDELTGAITSTPTTPSAPVFSCRTTPIAHSEPDSGFKPTLKLEMDKDFGFGLNLGLHNGFAPQLSPVTDFLPPMLSPPGVCAPTLPPHGMPAPSYSFFNRLGVNNAPQGCIQRHSPTCSTPGNWEFLLSNWNNPFVGSDALTKFDNRHSHDQRTVLNQTSFNTHAFSDFTCNQGASIPPPFIMAPSHMDNPPWLGMLNGFANSVEELLLPDKVSIHNSGLAAIQVRLTNADLWQRFHEQRTEMIVTRTGRKLFPRLSLEVAGLCMSAHYAIQLTICPIDNSLWRYQDGRWCDSGQADHSSPLVWYSHPDSPNIGMVWTRGMPITFSKVRLTNCKTAAPGQISLQTMRRYLPHILISLLNGEGQAIEWRTFSFPETEFIPVTAYQNSEVIQLKILNNPFAKGFRNKMRSSDETNGILGVDGPSLVSAMTHHITPALI